MKLTCTHCRRPLGLVSHTRTYWEGGWFRVARFCSMSCRNNFGVKKEEEDAKKKAVHRLFHPP